MPDDLPPPPARRLALVSHFCRMQTAGWSLPAGAFQRHLSRAFAVYAAKQPGPLGWDEFFKAFYTLDWYLASGCLESIEKAWEGLFALRTGKSDCLLVDALRARAHRLYPRDEDRQETAVHEFWSHLLVPGPNGSPPVLARFDGQRPLAPWLIRVFQNWHVSHLRGQHESSSLPEDDTLALPIPQTHDPRWHELFCTAARDWLATLTDQEATILGLRWRYRMSQRDVASLLKVHEGTISRQTDKLRDRALEQIGQQLVRDGFDGDELERFILTEMGGVLVDEPKLSADAIGRELRSKGLVVPPTPEAA